MKKIIRLFILSCFTLPGFQWMSEATSLTRDSLSVLDVNFSPLDLRLDTIYAIQNHATDLPLLHDRPGINITRLTHWWQLVHYNISSLPDNIYYLQIQDVKANNTAPRWQRLIQIRQASPGFYHLLPISCKKYTNATFIYVDYFDEYGRHASECVDIKNTYSGWDTPLENDSVSSQPIQPLARDNYEFKFISFNSALEDALKNSQSTMQFTSPCFLNDTQNTTTLSQLKLKESPRSDVGELGRQISTFECICKTPIILRRSYFNFTVQAWHPFQVKTVQSQVEQEDNRIWISIEGRTGGQIDNSVILQDPCLTLYINENGYDDPSKLRGGSITDLVSQILDSPACTLNYLWWTESSNDFMYHWESLAKSIQFGQEDSVENNCICTESTPGWNWRVLILIVIIVVIIVVAVLTFASKSSLKYFRYGGVSRNRDDCNL